MFSTIGDRIVYCRGFLDCTRKEFATQLGDVSLPTLSRWELNYVKIPQKKLERLVHFFNQKGIRVDIDWIRSGQGLPPINLNLKDFQDIKFDEISYSIMIGLHKTIKNFQFKQLNSNFYEPILSYGDYVSGITNTNPKLLDNKLCFVISETEVLVGILSIEDNSLKNIKNEKKYYDNFDNLIVGEVLWLARRP